MDWIAWDDTLDTGHAEMDADHKQLAGLFNRLRDALEGGEAMASCAEVLDDIIRHTRAHFELEQRLMIQHQYPKADQHAAEHAMLIRQAQDYRNSLDTAFAASRSAQVNSGCGLGADLDFTRRFSTPAPQAGGRGSCEGRWGRRAWGGRGYRRAREIPEGEARDDQYREPKPECKVCHVAHYTPTNHEALVCPGNKQAAPCITRWGGLSSSREHEATLLPLPRAAPP